jgi:Sulfotransferase domain
MTHQAPITGDLPAGGVPYAVQRLRRHWYWLRTQGLAHLVEEDRLNPVERVSRAADKWMWRRRHGAERGTAVPVFLVGVQRSGTNMLVRGFEAAPEFEVHNENDERAFHRFQLRCDEHIASMVRRSRHRYVLFKPLCDSHRVDKLLELPVPSPGRAIWAYRNVDDRARSAIAKFGDTNLQALARIARGDGEQLWQAQRLSPALRELIESFDYSVMTPETAAALFWYVRNCLFFDLGLDRREDVLLSSYDMLVADPEWAMRRLCNFLGFEWRPYLIGHVEPRARGARTRLAIDPTVRVLCDELGAALDRVACDR